MQENENNQYPEFSELLGGDLKEISESLETIRKALYLLKKHDIDEALRLLATPDKAHPPVTSVAAAYIAGRVCAAFERHPEAHTQYSTSRAFAENMLIRLRLASCDELEHFYKEGVYAESKALLATGLGGDELRNSIQQYINDYHKKMEILAADTIGKAKLWLSYHLKQLNERGLSLRGKKVLEIGVSVFPFMSYCYLFCGAEVTAIDKYRGAGNLDIVGPDGQIIINKLLFDALYDEVIAAGFAPADSPRIQFEDVVAIGRYHPEFIHPNLKILSGVDSGATGFPGGSFDYIFSLDTLEHVGDPEGDPEDTVNEIARLLKPGGWTAHRFGPIDHRDPDNKPYDHFLHSREEWLNLGVPHNQRTNRWVLSQWRQAFKSAGLEEVLMLPNACEEYIPPLTDDMIEKFHPDFKNLHRSDLETLVMVMILRKPE